ncbi:MAG: YdcF family protein, partial [Rickettsiales bacterium]
MKYIFYSIIVYVLGMIYYVYLMIPNQIDSLSKFDNKISNIDKNEIAIIALTGGSNRIYEAIELLSNDIGNKLLISGVNRAANIKDLEYYNSEIPLNLMQNMKDKITLGYDATNTKENASESKEWLFHNLFDNIILVTSHYHMPRSIHEFRLLMPKLNIIERPVFTNNVAKSSIWKFYIIEYNKY